MSKRKSISRKKRKKNRRELEGKQCYLCGEFGDILTDIPEEGRLTFEHVLPHGLSPLSPNSAFLLLPAHLVCNNKYSDQERKFIAYLAMVCGHKGNASADAAWAAAERSFKLNETGCCVSTGRCCVCVFRLAVLFVNRQGYVEMISDDIRLAQEPYRLVEAHPELQAFTQGLSITTFRYAPSNLTLGSEDTEC